jgi:hypothetical protein
LVGPFTPLEEEQEGFTTLLLRAHLFVPLIQDLQRSVLVAVPDLMVVEVVGEVPHKMQMLVLE